MAGELASDPKRVEVITREQGNGFEFGLRVAPEDRGRIIGRQGRTVRSIRSLMKAAAAKAGVRVQVEVIE